MANKPRGAKADKSKYAGRAYLNYEEAQDYLGLKRATLYNYIQDLDIQTHKFKRDRKRYLVIKDVQRIEQVMESPWLGVPDQKSIDANSEKKHVA